VCRLGAPVAFRPVRIGVLKTHAKDAWRFRYGQVNPGHSQGESEEQPRQSSTLPGSKFGD
jgi:hypothetical protein